MSQGDKTIKNSSEPTTSVKSTETTASQTYNPFSTEKSDKNFVKFQDDKIANIGYNNENISRYDSYLNEFTLGDNSGLAKVKEIEGVQVYIHAEPLREYEVVESKTGGIKAKSYFSKGLINNSIEEDVIQFVKKLTKWNKNLDGIIYSTSVCLAISLYTIVITIMK